MYALVNAGYNFQSFHNLTRREIDEILNIFQFDLIEICSAFFFSKYGLVEFRAGDFGQ